MAYNDITGLVDCFDGKGDLDRGIIRCVGDANERFDEDALRILRAIRFSAQLGFSIEEKTVEAIKEKAVNLSNISAERIKVELDKILTSKNPNRLINAYEYGVTNIILPEFDMMIATEQENPNHVYNVGLHTVKALENINNILKSKRDKVCVNKDELLSEKNQLMLRWTVLLHDVAKPDAKYFDEEGIAHFKMHEIMGVEKAKSVFNRLKFDRYTQDLSLRLIKYHDYRFSNTPVSMRRAASKIGKDIMELLFIVKEADIKAQNPITFDEKLSSLEESIKLFDNIKKENECLQIKDLVINGKDLIERGFKPGPEIGDCLDYLLNNVLDNPANNNVDKLLELVNSYVLNANK